MKKREFGLAVCSSRKSKKFHNEKWTWQDFVAKCCQTLRTSETYSEFMKMSRNQQTEIKDKGGFVAGFLNNGKRGRDTVKNRSMIALDADFPSSTFMEDVETLLPDNAWLVYSTHKHSPEKKRLRLIIPLARDVSDGEYEALARLICSKMGMDQWDATTAQPSRLMFWPTSSRDAEYFFQKSDFDDFLDPDSLLSELPDWRDMSCWPLFKEETEILKGSGKDQENPLEKKGVIGAWCRTYSISEVLEKFLSEVYEVTDKDDRYTYLNGTTAAGLVVYNADTLAYSNHSTDPAADGHSQNAFDLVRIHKFGDRDARSTTTDPCKKPSYKAMVEFATSDPECRKTMDRERLEEGLADFADEMDEMDGTDSVESFIKENTDWMSKLKRNEKTGEIEQTIDNCKLILLHDTNLKDTLGGYDDFAGLNKKFGSLPWSTQDEEKQLWSDSDDNGLQWYLEKIYGFNKPAKIAPALDLVQKQHRFHPVRDYLESITWDGKERLDTLFIEFLGSPDNAYVRKVTRLAFAACVARIYEPGCQLDYVFTIVGKQGVGKTHILRRMGGEWFSNSLTSMQGKEAYEGLISKWIIELGELAATKKTELEGQKNFITKTSDFFRKAYAKNPSDNPRQCVMFASSNDSDFIKDTTGGRRWAIIETDKSKRTLSPWEDLNDAYRDQLWAEAKVRYEAGEVLFLQGELEEEATRLQEKYSEHDPEEDMILNYLDTPIPANWYSLDIDTRRIFLKENEDFTDMKKREMVSVMEIWLECYGNDGRSIPNVMSRKIGKLLEKNGWKKTGERIRIDKFYSMQRVFRFQPAGN